jgi:hypothetical protein
MKSDFGDLEPGFSREHTTHNSSATAWQNGEPATTDALSLRRAWNPQVCWWGTDWFEEWERVARKE